MARQKHELNELEFSKELGEKIRYARKERGLLIKELGEKVNLDKSGIIRYESGTSIPTVTLAIRFAMALEVDPECLVFMKPQVFMKYMETLKQVKYGFLKSRE